VEISIIKVLPEGTEMVLTQRIDPEMPIPPESSAIHGIRDEDVKGMPTFREFAPRVAAFIEGCDLAGYNALRFDIPILAEELLRAEMDFDMQGRRVVDVQNIFHKMEPRHLAAAYRFYCGGKKLEGAHSAEADTRATLDILMAQLDMYEHADLEEGDRLIQRPVRNDVQALHDFSAYHRHADLAGNLIYNDQGEEVFNFGKHKGKLVTRIFLEEPSYYDWMMKSQFPEYTKKVITDIWRKRKQQENS